MARRFECVEDGAQKFWEITVDGAQHTVTYGRIGTTGQSKTKSFPTAAAAGKDAESLIRSKTAKGYVEVGGAPVAGPPSAAAAPVAGSPTGPSRSAPRAVATFTGKLELLCALSGSAFTLCLQDGETGGGTVGIWAADGRRIAEHRFPKASVYGRARTAAGELVFLCQDKVYRFSADGRRTIEPCPGALRVNIRADGSTVTAGKNDLSLRTADGTVMPLAGGVERGFGWPVVLPDDAIAVIAVEQPRRLLVFDRAGRPLIDAKLAANGATTPVRTPDGVIAVASGTTLHLFRIGAKKPVAVTLADKVGAGVLALPNSTIAVPLKNGQIEFIASDGRRLAVFRRDALGAGESSMQLAQLPDGSVVAPAIDGRIYRLDQGGALLGSLRLEGAGSPVALDDGTVVVPVGQTLHLLGAGDFTAGDAPAELPDVSGEKTGLVAHFASWALTPKCKKLLKEIMERLVTVERAADSLTLGFLTDEREVYQVVFGAPRTVTGWPASYQAVAALHGEITFGDGAGSGICFGDFSSELDAAERKRFREMCIAGQNWFLFDLTKTNKLGEPLIVLYDHGCGVSESTAFPGQNREAFGVGGVLIRALAHAVFSANQDYADWGWG